LYPIYLLKINFSPDYKHEFLDEQEEVVATYEAIESGLFPGIWIGWSF
jgi:hypothetical protein